MALSLRGSPITWIASKNAERWPGAVSLVAAAALLLIAWTASALAAPAGSAACPSAWCY